MGMIELIIVDASRFAIAAALAQLLIMSFVGKYHYQLPRAFIILGSVIFLSYILTHLEPASSFRAVWYNAGLTFILHGAVIKIRRLRHAAKHI